MAFHTGNDKARAHLRWTRWGPLTPLATLGDVLLRGDLPPLGVEVVDQAAKRVEVERSLRTASGVDPGENIASNGVFTAL